MQYIALFIVMAILAIYVIRRLREQFLETSYYYEAAPGARGSRLICMPESRGTASLGIDVNSAASKAVNSCAPLSITYKPKKKKRTIPKMCLQYMGSRKPTRVVPINDRISIPRCPPGTMFNGMACVAGQTSSPGCPPGTIWDAKALQCRAPSGKKTSRGCPTGMVWDGKKCKVPSGGIRVKTSRGCPTGMVWDGKKCKVPSALAKVVRTSKGCPTGMVWDGKKCKIPNALRAAIKDPSRPKTPKKKGKSTAKPDGKVKYRKVKGGTFPFMQVNGKWVQVKKVNGKWKVITVKKTTPSKKTAPKKTKSNCPSGKKWDGKKKKCVKK